MIPNKLYTFRFHFYTSMIGPKKNWPGRFFKTAFFLLFLMVSSYTLFQVYGYELSMRGGKIDIVRTSLVDIQTNVDDLPGAVNIFVDGKQRGAELPIMLSLVPGRYTIQIEKEGYFSWEKVVEVKPYYVTVLNKVFLVSRLAQESVGRVVEKEMSDFYLTADQGHVVFLSSDRRSLTRQSLERGDSFGLALPEYVRCDQFMGVGEGAVCVDQSGFRSYQALFVENKKEQFQQLEVPPIAGSARVFIKNRREIWEKKGLEEFLITRFSFELDGVNALDVPGALLISAGTRMMICDEEADNCLDLGRHTAGTPIQYLLSSDELLFIRDGYLYRMQLSALI